MPQPPLKQTPGQGNYLLEVVNGVTQPTPLGTNLSMASDGTLNASGTGGTAGLIGIQYITATGAYTYTPTAGTQSIVFELVGGGGGGSGVPSPGSGNWYLGAGGQGGGYIRKRLTTNFSGATGVIGAKGAGGAAGANDGATGSDTTFVDTSPTTYTAKGGAGASRNGPFAAPFISGIPTSITTTGGDLAMLGGLGTIPFSLNANNGASGSGGASPYSLGSGALTNGSTNGSIAGVNATGHGGGGSGAITSGTGAAAAGGDGSDGLVIVYEYS